MADVTIKKLDEFEAGFGGGFKWVRDGLGVTSFGIQVIQMPPNYADYPEHDHDDGQEEVYAVLKGSATLKVGGEEHTLEPDTYVRVGPAETRKIIAGPKGVQLLCIGGIPGRPYEIPEYGKPPAEAVSS